MSTSLAPPSTTTTAASLFTALRPWSFPASLQGVLLGNALAYVTSPSTFSYLHFAVGALTVLALHSAGNLTNSYYDYTSGLDTKATADDRALVDHLVTLRQVKHMMLVSYLLGACGTLHFLLVSFLHHQSVVPLLALAATGFFLAWSYTAPPLALKYHALGDIVIFLAFGPALVQFAYYVQTLQLSVVTTYWSIGGALIVQGILHANNTRDCKADAVGHAVTIPQLLGHKWSTVLYVALLTVPYVLVAVHALQAHSHTLLLPLISAPLAYTLCTKFAKQDWTDICPLNGQLAAAFGVLQAVSVVVARDQVQHLVVSVSSALVK